MKKSLIALAVAGVFAVPAYAATSNVDVYGVLGISVEDNDGDFNDQPQVTDRQSRIGFKGSEDLGGGMKAIWQIEQAISSQASGQDGVGGASLANRNSFVGLSGGFGTVLLGRHDTPYKLSTSKLDVFVDTVADYNVAEGFNLTDFDDNDASGALSAGDDIFTLVAPGLIDPIHDYRAPGTLAYVSPNFSGFSFAAALVMTNNNASLTRDGKVSLGNLGTDNSLDAYSLSASYENGPLYIGVGYQDVGAEDLGIEDTTAWKVGAGYSFGDLKIGAVYEDVSDALVGSVCRASATGFVPAANLTGPTATQCVAANSGILQSDRDSWLVNVSYAMGPIVLKGEYGQADIDDIDLEVEKWAVGAEYHLSKRTNVYAIYNSTDLEADGDDGDVGAFALGVRHSF
jgi:predicted porin